MAISWDAIPTFCGMFFSHSKFTEDGLMPLSWAVVNGNPYMKQVPPNFPGIRRRAARIASQNASVRLPLYWNRVPGRTQDGSETNVYVKSFTTKNSPTFSWGREKAFLSLLTFDTADDPTRGNRPVFLAKLYRKAVEAMQVDFAWLDDFGQNVFRDDRREVDLRRFAWGAACYGPDLVQLIGEEKLASCPAYAVDRLDWGGYWVQLGENPFMVDSRAKIEVAKHLGLDTCFTTSHGPRQLTPTGTLQLDT